MVVDLVVSPRLLPADFALRRNFDPIPALGDWNYFENFTNLKFPKVHKIIFVLTDETNQTLTDGRACDAT